MNDIFTAIGLSPKETKMYLLLLEEPAIGGAEAAKKLAETRSNTYMLLTSLIEKGLVTYDDDQPKRRFYAIDPIELRKIVADKQKKLKQVEKALIAELPSLTSKYRLAHQKPGVVYRQGLDGLKESLEDMIRSKQEVLLFPGDVGIDNRVSETFEVLLKAMFKRKSAGIPTRTLLYSNARTEYKNIHDWPKRGVQVRFFGENPFDGEVVIYGDKCAFTVYEPELIVTTITNKQIANTMRLLFESMWLHAEPL